MKFVEKTVEEIQMDGTVVLRKVIVPMSHSNNQVNQERVGGVTVIQIWGDPDSDLLGS